MVNKTEQELIKSMLAEPDMVARDSFNEEFSMKKEASDTLIAKAIRLAKQMKSNPEYSMTQMMNELAATNSSFDKDSQVSVTSLRNIARNALRADEVSNKLKKERDGRDDGGLIGGQKKLDLNNDGDLDEEDFKLLREQKNIGGVIKSIIKQLRTPNSLLRKRLNMSEDVFKVDDDGNFIFDGPVKLKAFQEGGMAINDQMDAMMEKETMPTMDNQMADMMPSVAKTPEEELQERKEIEESQVPDEMMEDNYIDFLIDEALDEEEETMLMQELEANPQLSMLFDKVMEVAMEFSGSGPVEGPGSEVSDSIPARLSDGEFVFTAKAVDVIGADNLMSMMKQAEAQADERQMAQEGGLMETEDTVMPVEQEPIKQEIRVTKETVGPQASMQEEDDLVGDEIKKSMLSGRPHVRS